MNRLSKQTGILVVKLLQVLLMSNSPFFFLPLDNPRNQLVNVLRLLLGGGGREREIEDAATTKVDTVVVSEGAKRIDRQGRCC